MLKSKKMANCVFNYESEKKMSAGYFFCKPMIVDKFVKNISIWSIHGKRAGTIRDFYEHKAEIIQQIIKNQEHIKKGNYIFIKPK